MNYGADWCTQPKSTRSSCLAREAAPMGLKVLGRQLARVHLEQRVKLARTGSTRVRVGVCHDHLPCDVTSARACGCVPCVMWYSHNAWYCIEYKAVHIAIMNKNNEQCKHTKFVPCVNILPPHEKRLQFICHTRLGANFCNWMLNIFGALTGTTRTTLFS